MKFDAEKNVHILHTGESIDGDFLRGPLDIDPGAFTREERQEIATFIARQWLAWGCAPWLRGEPMVADLPDGSKPPEGFTSWELFGKYADLSRAAEELKGMMIDRNPLQQQFIFECFVKGKLAPGTYYYPSSMGFTMTPYRALAIFPGVPDGVRFEVQVSSMLDGDWMRAFPDKKDTTEDGIPTYMAFNLLVRYARLKVEIPADVGTLEVRIDAGRGYSLEEIYEAHKKWVESGC